MINYFWFALDFIKHFLWDLEVMQTNLSRLNWQVVLICVVTRLVNFEGVKWLNFFETCYHSSWSTLDWSLRVIPEQVFLSRWDRQTSFGILMKCKLLSFSYRTRSSFITLLTKILFRQNFMRRLHLLCTFIVPKNVILTLTLHHLPCFLSFAYSLVQT